MVSRDLFLLDVASLECPRSAAITGTTQNHFGCADGIAPTGYGAASAGSLECPLVPV
ncbi:hypothetical protein [Sulfuracidifex tepidarius]|uniref:hypothetical protein n=1 Tax=Sulfuracidifex tepidarius TaxID=1294262 RepID=UPI00138FC608|nr:hypothetical protein [Sulfuracidifex tepidarius]